jgi:predicted cobalt transporter CbtA
MLRQLLVCGLIAGVCGGLLATGFATFGGEPAVNRSIAYEQAHTYSQAAKQAAMHHEALGPDPVSRSLQKSAGLLTAATVYGLSFGGMFALAFAFAYGRVGRASPRMTAYLLAAAAFVVVYLVPFVKYPASPPGTTNPDTIGKRTALYMTMIAISVLAAIAAARLRPGLARRFSSHTANLGAGLMFLVVVVASGLVLPGVHEIPKDFPATVLWRFREASVGMQAVLWSTIGLVFAPAAQRVLNGQPIFARRAVVREALQAD